MPPDDISNTVWALSIKGNMNIPTVLRWKGQHDTNDDIPDSSCDLAMDPP